ncbi:MAG: D-alanyl-D-alanine carboxypeptidase [Clostridia bacterium]|nr:D-alanyl-D-alanine carboxypeptidase [Clostridia bacterium]
MKKLFSVIMLVIALSLCAMTNIESLGVNAAPSVDVSSSSAYLMDYNSKTVIFAKGENKRLTIASMTKIMLLNLCFEKLDEGEFTLEDEITISKNASGMGGSQVFLESGKSYKAGDLIKSIIVASANDASVAMAERLFGSEEACVDIMNEKCTEWGLTDTLFSNCTGLPKPTQYSCAKDVATMLTHLLSHKEYFNYSNIWMDEIEHEGGRTTGLTNTNKLIRFYDGCDGGKTGYTQESGFCLAATAKRGAMRLIAVIIKAKDGKTRFAEASSLFNYGFENYTEKMVVDSSKPLDITVSIENGREDKVPVRPLNDIYIFSERNKKDKITVDFVPEKKIVAPIKEGDVVGKLTVFKDNIEFSSVDVVSLSDIDKKTYFDYIKDISKKWQI